VTISISIWLTDPMFCWRVAVRSGTRNTRSRTGKADEATETLLKCKVDICCVQESLRKEVGTKMLGKRA